MFAALVTSCHVTLHVIDSSLRAPAAASFDLATLAMPHNSYAERCRLL